MITRFTTIRTPATIKVRCTACGRSTTAPSNGWRAARHRLGEPWWDFPGRAYREPLGRLEQRGLVELVNDSRANLTQAGRELWLDPDWKPAHVRAQEDLAENLTDTAGLTWWVRQGARRGMTPEDALGMAAVARESIREWGRLLDEGDAVRYREMLGDRK